MQKRMYKVITPIEHSGTSGGKHWLRLGTAFTNKDDSINVHLDALPLGATKDLVLQLRELTEEELRRSSERRTSYAAPHPLTTASAAADAAPF